MTEYKKEKTMEVELKKYHTDCGVSTVLVGPVARTKMPVLIIEHKGIMLRQLDSAVDALREQPARSKRRILAAVLVTIRHDQEIRVAELELFRAIAATLDVPAPPLAAGALV